MHITLNLFLVVVGAAVFLVAGALTRSLRDASFLWMDVVPREDRMLMTAVAASGLLAALSGAARMAWARIAARAESRRARSAPRL